MIGRANLRSVPRDPEGLIHQPHSGKRESFRVDINLDHATVVRPVGELDLFTVDELERALQQAFDLACGQLVLDLRGLSFMDSQGLHLVTRWNCLTKESGVTFVVIQGAPAIRRVFEVVGLLDRLPFADSVGAVSVTGREGVNSAT